jgi:shikimate dehydrogenase
MKQYGLIGYPLAHSFSENYFKDKFRREKINDCVYNLFPLKHINQLPEFINENPSLCGLNVTVPYKESVIRHLDELDEQAKKVGAVNCIKISRQHHEKKLVGYNTDVIGFEDSLKPILKSWHQHAIILGTGGGAKAVAYVLKKLGITFTYVSRNPGNSDTLGYPDLTKPLIQKYLLIINTTPLGMFPQTQTFPQFPYEQLGERHLLFDLIYNPEQTLFLQKGKKQGAAIKNGLEMLYIQAEKSWEIWEK